MPSEYVQWPAVLYYLFPWIDICRVSLLVNNTWKYPAVHIPGNFKTIRCTAVKIKQTLDAAVFVEFHFDSVWYTATFFITSKLCKPAWSKRRISIQPDVIWLEKAGRWFRDNFLIIIFTGSWLGTTVLFYIIIKIDYRYKNQSFFLPG